jgi:hypothetical protein
MIRHVMPCDARRMALPARDEASSVAASLPMVVSGAQAVRVCGRLHCGQGETCIGRVF